MLRDDIEQYTSLTGEDGWHVPIIKVGAYLDGYNKGLEVLDKIKNEIRATAEKQGDGVYYLRDEWIDEIDEWIDEIIDKYKENPTA